MSNAQLSAQAGVEEGWAELPWQEKRERRFQRWLSAPGVDFVSPEAQAAYRARGTRIVKCIRLEQPDRAPPAS